MCFPESNQSPVILLQSFLSIAPVIAQYICFIRQIITVLGYLTIFSGWFGSCKLFSPQEKRNSLCGKYHRSRQTVHCKAFACITIRSGNLQFIPQGQIVVTGNIIDHFLRCIRPCAAGCIGISCIIYLWMPHTSCCTVTHRNFHFFLSADIAAVFVIKHMSAHHVPDIIRKHSDAVQHTRVSLHGTPKFRHG